MTVILADRMTFDAPRRTKEGYMAVRAKAARAGVYDYLGAEVDPTGTKFKPDQIVKVYRPEDEVFSAPSIRSFVMRPITNNHPSEAVTADNWSQHAKGVVAGAIRDGEYVSFDLAFMDAATISEIQSGKRELSNGYAVDLAFEDGTAPDGTAYQAVQRNIVGNHVALVDKGRAGPDCAIKACDAIPPDAVSAILANIGDKSAMKTILIDGHSVEVSDAAEIAVKNLIDKAAKLETDLAAANTKVGELTASVSTKDGEIAGLTAKLADAEKVDVDALIAEREAVVGDAKKVFADLDPKGKSVADIRKEAVLHKLGDAAKTMDDNAIMGAFTALAASAPAVDPLRAAIGDITPQGNPAQIADAAFAKSVTDLNAWRKEA